MEQIYERLDTIISNAKKSLVRGYTNETILAKRKEIEELESKSGEFLSDKVITEQQRRIHKIKFEERKVRALEILKSHEDRLIIQGLQDQIQELTMTNENLNTTELAEISKLLKVFDGSKDELQPFISNIEIIKETLTATKHNSFFNFVYKTKITNKVQTKLRQTTIPTSIETLIATLKETYRSKKSPNVILNELTTIKQFDTIRKFADKVEALTMELNEIQISSLGEDHRDIISKTNAVVAFNSFKNGLKNQDVVRTIEASRVKTLNEAINIAIETSTDLRQNQILFQTARNRNNNYQRNGNTYNNNQSSRNNNYNRHNNNNNNRNSNFNSNNSNSRRNYNRINEYAGNNSRNDYRNDNSYGNGNNNNNNNNYRGNNNYNNSNNYRNNNYNRNRGNTYNNTRTRRVNHVENDQGNFHGPETSGYQGTPEENQ